MAKTTLIYLKAFLVPLNLLVSLALVALALYIDINYYQHYDHYTMVYDFHISVLLLAVADLLYCLAYTMWTLSNWLIISKSSSIYSSIQVIAICISLLLSTISMGSSIAVANLLFRNMKETTDGLSANNYKYVIALIPLLFISQFIKGLLNSAELSLICTPDSSHMDPDESYITKESADNHSYSRSITKISPTSHQNNNPYRQAIRDSKQLKSSLEVFLTPSNNSNLNSNTNHNTTPKHFSAYNTTPPLTQQQSSSTTSLIVSDLNTELANKQGDLILSKSQLSPIQEPDNSFISLNDDSIIHPKNSINPRKAGDRQIQMLLSDNFKTDVSGNSNKQTNSNASYKQNLSTPNQYTYSRTTPKLNIQSSKMQIYQAAQIPVDPPFGRSMQQSPGLKITPKFRRSSSLRIPSAPLPSIPLDDQESEIVSQRSDSSITNTSKANINQNREQSKESVRPMISVETNWTHNQDGRDVASINTASLWPFMKSPVESRSSPTFGHFHRENIQKRTILPKIVKMNASAIESELNSARAGSISSVESLIERHIQQRINKGNETDNNDDTMEISYSASMLEKPDNETMDNDMVSDTISVYPKCELDDGSYSVARPHNDSYVQTSNPITEDCFSDYITSDRKNINDTDDSKHESIFKKIKRRSISPLKKGITDDDSLEQVREENRRQILNNINNPSSMKERLNNSPLKKRISNFSSLGNIDFDFVKHDNHSNSTDASDNYLDIIGNYDNENITPRRTSKIKSLGLKMNLETIKSVFNHDSNNSSSPENVQANHSFTIYRHTDNNVTSNKDNSQTAWNWNVEDSTKNFVNDIMYDKDAGDSENDTNDSDNSEDYDSEDDNPKTFQFKVPGFRSKDSNNNQDTSIGSYFNEEFSIIDTDEKPQEYSDIPSNTTVSKFSHMVSNSISLIAKKTHKRSMSFATENHDINQFDDSAIHAIENFRNSSDSFNFADQTGNSNSSKSISEYNKEKSRILDR